MWLQRKIYFLVILLDLNQMTVWDKFCLELQYPGSNFVSIPENLGNSGYQQHYADAYQASNQLHPFDMDNPSHTTSQRISSPGNGSLFMIHHQKLSPKSRGLTPCPANMILRNWIFSCMISFIYKLSNSNHVSSTLGLKNALQGIDSFSPFACLQDSALSRLWPAFVNDIYYQNHFSCLEKKRVGCTTWYYSRWFSWTQLRCSAFSGAWFYIWYHLYPFIIIYFYHVVSMFGKKIWTS